MTPDPQMVETVRRRLAVTGEDATPATVAAAVAAGHGVVGTQQLLAVVDLLRAEALGAGPLEPLLRLEGVTDVLVNGPDEVYLDRGRGLERQPIGFPDDAAVRRLAQRLAAHAGRRLDEASPWVDARLPDGTRVHAVLTPLARPGTTISLRIPARRSFSLTELVRTGAIDDEGADLLRALVAARAAFVVTGGTGSGKTTVLAALLGEVPADERLVVVEDASELRPDHPHVVGLEARPPNVEGAGAVSVRDLVRQALRMRPDRLVVGEVRGGEVVDLLAALNTGHEGGCGTVHANAPAVVPARFEALGVAAGLARDAVHSQLAAGLDAVIHVGRTAGRRHIAEIAGVTRSPSGFVEVATAWCVRRGRVSEGSDVLGQVLAR